MQVVNFNKCLNREHKLYGLSYAGLISAGIIGVGFWVRFGMTTGMICSAIAYSFCAYYANLWHEGSLQRFIVTFLVKTPSFSWERLQSSIKILCKFDENGHI